MMPILTAPAALLALLALPALVAIYFFQRRFRTREVSSLLLSNWNRLSPSLRQSSIEVLLSRDREHYVVNHLKNRNA